MILRAWTETLEGNLNWRNDAEEVIKQVNENSYLLGTIFLFPMGPTSTFSNKIFANNLWPSNLKYKFFMSNKLAKLPQFHFKDGLTHSKGTLCSAISLACSLGYKNIVLIGVDLYDNRYFWLPSDKTLGWCEKQKKLMPMDVNPRGLKPDEKHNTATQGIIDVIFIGATICIKKSR